MKIFIGADHRGFELKQQLIEWLQTQGHQVTDCGNSEFDPNDDFPQFGEAVAREVAHIAEARGIVICGTGVGVCIAANRVAGSRCVLALDPTLAAAARVHDNANILALAADFTSFDEAIALVTTFLANSFDTDPRRQRRIDQLDQIKTLE